MGLSPIHHAHHAHAASQPCGVHLSSASRGCRANTSQLENESANLGVAARRKSLSPHPAGKIIQCKSEGSANELHWGWHSGDGHWGWLRSANSISPLRSSVCGRQRSGRKKNLSPQEPAVPSFFPPPHRTIKPFIPGFFPTTSEKSQISTTQPSLVLFLIYSFSAFPKKSTQKNLKTTKKIPDTYLSTPPENQKTTHQIPPISQPRSGRRPPAALPARKKETIDALSPSRSLSAVAAPRARYSCPASLHNLCV